MTLVSIPDRGLGLLRLAKAKLFDAGSDVSIPDRGLGLLRPELIEPSSLNCASFQSLIGV